MLEDFKKIYSWPNILFTIAAFLTLDGMGDFLFKNQNVEGLAIVLFISAALAGIWFLLKKDTKKKHKRK